MNLKSQMILRSNNNLRNYIREHSYLYKELNRNGEVINEIIEDMKKEYKLNPEDKLNELSDKLGLVNEFMKIIG